MMKYSVMASLRIIKDESLATLSADTQLTVPSPNITLTQGPPYPAKGSVALRQQDLGLYYADGTFWKGLISSSSGSISISGTPVVGEVLTATSATTADWEFPRFLATTGLPVEVDLSAPPVAGQTLVATNPTTAIWATPAAAALGYGYFYGLTSGTGNGGPTDYAATIAAGAAVPFPRLGPATADITATGTTTFQLANTGTYEVTFRVHTTEPGQLQLYVDGVPQPQTTAVNMNPTSGGHPIVGTSIITTGAPNAIVSVFNPAGNSTALTITPADGSDTWANSQSITFKRLA